MSGIQAAHAAKLGRQLTALDAASRPEDMNRPRDPAIVLIRPKKYTNSEAPSGSNPVTLANSPE